MDPKKTGILSSALSVLLLGLGALLSMFVQLVALNGVPERQGAIAVPSILLAGVR